MVVDLDNTNRRMMTIMAMMIKIRKIKMVITRPTFNIDLDNNWWGNIFGVPNLCVSILAEVKCAAL